MNFFLIAVVPAIIILAILYYVSGGENKPNPPVLEPSPCGCTAHFMQQLRDGSILGGVKYDQCKYGAALQEVEELREDLASALHPEFGWVYREQSEIQSALDEAERAINHFIPVLDWLAGLKEDTHGRQLAKQLKPYLDNAKDKINAYRKDKDPI